VEDDEEVSEMAKLTRAQRTFIHDNPYYAVVTTLREDGSPHATVVWVDEDGGDVIINTAYPRKKAQELENDSRASVMVVDPADPYRWVSVSGRAELSTAGADDVIDALSRKYLGHEYRNHKAGETRVTARITPDRITAAGIE
jgi:PPOX class probable F420-dependent enzyme